jgi:Methyltransferase domain
MKEIIASAPERFFTDDQNIIPGWCPNQLAYVLNTLVECMPDNEVYLEIGTFCGKSLVGAMRSNWDKKAIVIDPLNLWTEKGTIESLWNKAIDDNKLRDRVTLYKEYAENFAGELPPVGIFFYDGNHDSGHTYEGLNKYSKFLAPYSVIIVDDYNIYGGDQQKVFSGHALDINHPVKTDTDKWIAENQKNIIDVHFTPWLNGQAIIEYEKL